MVTLSLAGPLVAGGVQDTTLTCSAMVDRSVVDRGTILYAFTWRDRDGRTVESGGRTIISTAAPQSSTLTLSPLNTADTNFTCAVAATESQNTLVPSELGEMSTPVSVMSESVSPALHLPMTVCPTPSPLPLQSLLTLWWRL